MAGEEFELPKSGWAVLTQILRGYFHAGGRKSRDTVTQKTLAQYTGIERTQISQNNAFFVSIGALERENRSLRLTEAGLELALALDHQDSPAIQSSLRSLYSDLEFISSILSAVKVRNGMDTESLEKHVLLSAGAPSKPKHETGARALIESLELAGLLTEEDGKWMFVEAEEAPRDSRQEGGSGTPRTVRPKEVSASQPLEFAAPVSIELSLTSEDLLDEERLEELADAVRRLQELLLRPEPSEGEGDSGEE